VGATWAIGSTIIGIGEADKATGGNVDKSTGGNYKKARDIIAPKPKMPAIPPIPLWDEQSAGTADKTARERQRQRAVQAYGRSDTILTGGLGLIGDRAPAGQRKTLIGL